MNPIFDPLAEKAKADWLFFQFSILIKTDVVPFTEHQKYFDAIYNGESNER